MNSRIALLLFFLLCSGCANLRPVVDNTRFFILTSKAPNPAITNAHLRVSIGLGPVALPDHLRNNREIACVRNGSELYYPGSLRWAESLEKNVQRVLTANLSKLLYPASILTAAWRRTDIVLEIHVMLLLLELTETGQVRLHGLWRVRDPAKERNLLHEEVNFLVDGPPVTVDPPGAVGTLSEALLRLSSAIGDSVRSVLEQSPREDQRSIRVTN